MPVDLSNLRRAIAALDEGLSILHREQSNHADPGLKTLLRDAEAWMLYLRQRNLTSRVYDQSVAEAIFSAIPEFLEDARWMLARLEERLT